MANTLSFALYSLSQNLECQEKLYKEIKDTLRANNTDQVTPELVGQLPYLQCILKESLRY